jgi:LacI family transcriptional regulator
MQKNHLLRFGNINQKKPSQWCVGYAQQFISQAVVPLRGTRTSSAEMGRAAVELLLQIVESKRPIKDFERRVLTPELIIRESSLRSMG